jgi:hypothetical protein
MKLLLRILTILILTTSPVFSQIVTVNNKDTLTCFDSKTAKKIIIDLKQGDYNKELVGLLQRDTFLLNNKVKFLTRLDSLHSLEKSIFILKEDTYKNQVSILQTSNTLRDTKIVNLEKDLKRVKKQRNIFALTGTGIVAIIATILIVK